MNVSLGSMSSTTILFSEFDDENSTKDAFSDILKSIVQKIFPMGYLKCSSLRNHSVSATVRNMFLVQTCLHQNTSINAGYEGFDVLCSG